jgi:hypothetical protein
MHRTCRVVAAALSSACLAVTIISCSSKPPSKVASPKAASARNREPEPYTVDDSGEPLPPLMVKIVREIYLAATHANYAVLTNTLDTYCAGSAMAPDRRLQIEAWHRRSFLREMAALLMTHAAPTDGYTYPSFSLDGFVTKYNYEDAAYLHVSAPPIGGNYAGYRGYIMYFRYGNPLVAKSPVWCGMNLNYK